ncbi:MAG: DUF3179 domain-containing (seleno)protein [Saprospiraceae bacterium]
MKKLFWTGVVGVVVFEWANVYFIMPMPGSQEMHSIDLAYFLYHWRWAIRVIFTLFVFLGWTKLNLKKKWLIAIPFLIIAASIYMTNFYMAADHMFYQPDQKIMLPIQANKVDPNRLVIGVMHNNVAKAYPIRFLGYHHQVLDTIGGKPIMVTYCTVCRTGRVYEPLVNGVQETFRLVGMDHFNAMFEDGTTKSWWRQVNGEAITGKLKGQSLPEVFSIQASLFEWVKMYPHTLIMQADSAYIESYSENTDYETGKSRKELTGTDSLSWNKKSWVIGVKAGKETKAYDWNRLKTEKIIHDEIKGIPVLILMARDTIGFFAFERPALSAYFDLNDSVLVCNKYHFTLQGKGIDTSYSLKPLPAYQEFWHSWKAFNPGTLR